MSDHADADVIPLRPPQSPQSLEARVLGALVGAGVALGPILAASGITPEDLPSSRGRAILAVVLRLADSGGPVTPLTVHAAGRLSDSDGAWLERLVLANTSPPEALPVVLDEVRRSARLHRAAREMGELSTELARRGPAPDLLGRHARLTAELEAAQPGVGSSTAADSLAQLAHDWLAAQTGDGPRLLPTGLRLLDQAIGGGLTPTLVLVVGQPGSGKTGTVVSWIRAQLERSTSLRVGYLGLEDGPVVLSRRWLAEDLGLPMSEIGRGQLSPELQAASHEAMARRHPLLARVLTPARHVSRMPRSQVLAQLRAWRADGVGEVVIENFSQICTEPIDGKRWAPRIEPWQHVEETAEALRDFALASGIPVIGIVHEKLATDTRNGRPSAQGPAALGQLRGGQSLDQKARLVLACWRKGWGDDALWRLTVLKANEQPGEGTTLQWVRNPPAGTICPGLGEVVNLMAEAAQERSERQDANDAAFAKRRVQREEATRAQRAAVVEAKRLAKEAARPAQGELLEGGRRG